MQLITQRLNVVRFFAVLLNSQGRMARNEFWFSTLTSISRGSLLILTASAILTAATLLGIPIAFDYLTTSSQPSSFVNSRFPRSWRFSGTGCLPGGSMTPDNIPPGSCCNFPP